MTKGAKKDHKQSRKDQKDVHGSGTRDTLLGFIVNMVDHFDLSVPVTFTTPAGMMTGTLIGRREYLRQLSESLANAGPIGESLSEFTQPEEAPSADSFDAESMPNLMHVSNASVLFANSISPTHGILLRQKVEDVSGWALGRLSRGR